MHVLQNDAMETNVYINIQIKKLKPCLYEFLF